MNRIKKYLSEYCQCKEPAEKIRQINENPFCVFCEKPIDPKILGEKAAEIFLAGLRSIIAAQAKCLKTIVKKDFPFAIADKGQVFCLFDDDFDRDLVFDFLNDIYPEAKTFSKLDLKKQ